jgi:hypothetical protein
MDSPRGEERLPASEPELSSRDSAESDDLNGDPSIRTKTFADQLGGQFSGLCDVVVAQLSFDDPHE